MSQENVEIVRASIEAWNAGDMDALREGYDPDVIVRAPPGWPEPGPFVGREALMRQWAQQRETFEADSVELITDFIHVADRVVVRFVWHGMGHGPETGLEMTQVNTVRKGRTIYQEFFWDHAEALEAVGLSEQDAKLLSQRDTARARSQENVDVLKASLAAWNAGDMDAFRELNDPNVIMWPVEGWPEPGPFVGVEAVIKQFAQQRDAFDFDKAEPVGEFTGVGDRVFFRLSYSGSGRGPEASMELTIMVTVRKGKIVYREYFRNHAEALEAVGLSEPDAHADSP